MVEAGELAPQSSDAAAAGPAAGPGGSGAAAAPAAGSDADAAAAQGKIAAADDPNAGTHGGASPDGAAGDTAAAGVDGSAASVKEAAAAPAPAPAPAPVEAAAAAAASAALEEAEAPAPAVAEAEAVVEAPLTERWQVDMDLMHRAVRALFSNEFSECEALLKKGMEMDAPSGGEGNHDIRGSFALVYALVAVMRGIATFADDQLKECEARLRQADHLAAEEASNWAGKKVTRGICTLQIGLVQLLQHSYVKGIYNILKSWTWIKTLKSEALNYAGKEREVVRSAALFTLGMFYLLIGLLPPTTMKVASWLSGFPGDRNEGIQMIRTCWEEAGMMQPWAALSLISYHVDTKTFLGEALTDKERAETKEVVDWAASEFPGSLFFTGLTADYVAVVHRDVPRARAMQEAEESKMVKLPALLWVLNYKRGIYALTDQAWYAAGGFFRASIKVYRDAGRRSMVPFMAGYSLLCFLQSKAVGQESEASERAASEMIALLREYKAMSKKDWGRQDTWAFEVLEGHEASNAPAKKSRLGRRKAAPSRAQQWPLLRLAQIMVLQVRCTWWMSKAQLGSLHGKLQTELAARLAAGTASPDQELRLVMCEIDILRQRGDTSGALKQYERAVELDGKQTTEGNAFGAMAMIEYFVALIHYQLGDMGAAKYHLGRVKKRGTKYELYQLIMLKTVALSRSVGSEIEADYETLDLSAGASKGIQLDIPAQIDQVPSVKWFWLVHKHTVSFSASFTPAAPDAKEVQLQKVDRKAASEDATVGELALEEHGAGTLTLLWDNSFSMLRAKTVRYRLSPPDLVVRPIS